MTSWWLVAIYVSFGHAFRSNLNSHYKIDGVRARFWSSLFALILMSPSMFLVEWPRAVEFYMAVGVGGVLVSFLSVKLLDLSAQYGGPVSTLNRPFHILFSFVLWGALTLGETVEQLSNPWVLGGVCVSFAMAFWAQYRLSRDGEDIQKALTDLIRVGVIGAFMSVVVKFGTGFTDTLMGVVLWATLTQIVVTVLSFARLMLRHVSPSEFSTKRIVKAGFVMGLANVLIVPGVLVAMRDTPNPAYASMIFMLSTVWLMLYYKIKGQDARVKPIPVALLLCAAVVLILATNNI